MNVIEGTNPYGEIGKSLGTGLGQGLQSLANMKLNEITAQKQQAKASQFWKGLGLNDQMANQFASAPEAIQKSILDRLEGINIGGQQQEQVQQPQMLDQLLGRQEGFNPAELEQALQSYQEPQAQPTQQGGIKIGANPVERRANAALEQADRLAKEKAEAILKAAEENRKFEREKLDTKQKQARQVANSPIIKGVTEDFNNSKKIYSIAKEMKKIIEENKKDWPEWSGYLPEKAHRNPHVRKYLKLRNQLTSAITGARKGVSTNYKLKLEERSGPDLSQPVETQESVLDDFINGAQETFTTFKDMGEITKRDPYADLAIELGNKSVQRLDQNEKPEQETFKDLPDASKFDGKIATNPSTGKRMKSVNGKWKAIAA